MSTPDTGAATRLPRCARPGPADRRPAGAAGRRHDRRRAAPSPRSPAGAASPRAWTPSCTAGRGDRLLATARPACRQLRLYADGLRARERRAGPPPRCATTPAARTRSRCSAGAAAPMPGDARLLDRCAGATLDVGCGPGPAHRRAPAGACPCSASTSAPEAVRLTRRRGAAALRRDVFGPIPGEGRWRTCCWPTATSGSAATRGACCGAAAKLLAPGGRLLCESTAPGTAAGRPGAAARPERGAASRSRWAPSAPTTSAASPRDPGCASGACGRRRADGSPADPP